MEKKYKLVLCDVDGTLLNSKKELTQNTKESIARLKENGIYFGIASGRGISGLNKKVKEWGIEEYIDVFIAMNGVQLIDCRTKKQTSYFTLSSFCIKEIMEEYRKFDINPCVYYGDILLCEREDELTIEAANSTSLKLKKVNFEEFYQCDREKLLYIAQPQVIDQVEYYANTHCISEEYRGVRTAPHMFEFINKKVSKSYGINEYCKLYGLRMEEVVAFGDASNDIEMLKDCGLGICMENGTEDAKAVANKIALSNDEDGVAKMLDELFLFDKKELLKHAFRLMLGAENLKHALKVYCTFLKRYQYTLKENLDECFDMILENERKAFNTLLSDCNKIDENKQITFLMNLHALAIQMLKNDSSKVEEIVEKMLEVVPVEYSFLKEKLHKKIAVSACLVGVNCKYNGGNNALKQFAFDQEDKILICPEMQGGLPCPRDPSEIKGNRVVSSKGKDVTAEFRKGAQLALKQIQESHCTLVILKAKSPSCGIHQVYDGTFSSCLIKGSGISAQLIQEAGINVIDEKEYQWIMALK